MISVCYFVRSSISFYTYDIGDFMNESDFRKMESNFKRSEAGA